MNNVLRLVYLVASVSLMVLLSPLAFLVFLVDCWQKRDVIANQTRSKIGELKLPQYGTPQELKI